jgi:hypothetical protein
MRHCGSIKAGSGSTRPCTGLVSLLLSRRALLLAGVLLIDHVELGWMGCVLCIY